MSDTQTDILLFHKDCFILNLMVANLFQKKLLEGHQKGAGGASVGDHPACYQWVVQNPASVTVWGVTRGLSLHISAKQS